MVLKELGGGTLYRVNSQSVRSENTASCRPHSQLASYSEKKFLFRDVA